MVSEYHNSLLHLDSNSKSKVYDENAIASTLFLKKNDMVFMNVIPSR